MTASTRRSCMRARARARVHGSGTWTGKNLILDETLDADIYLQREALKKVNTFTYLGSTLVEDGKLDAEVTHKVQSWWKNWRRVYVVLCDRDINVNTNGKVFRTMVRPAVMCGGGQMN